MFENIEESRQLGEPVTLYLFRFGTSINSYIGYTDAEQEIVFNGFTFRPEPIERGSVVASGTLDKAALEIRTRYNSDLSELFRVYPPGQVITLVIFQGHKNDPDNQFLAMWTGRVLSCAREDVEAKFTCEPVSTSMRRPALRRNYQYGCPHVLYGPQCRASRSLATRTVGVAAIANTIITLSPGWNGATPSSKYIGGMFEWNNSGETEVRTILRVTGNDIMISGLTRGLVAGVPAKVVLGCDHTMNDCRNLHNNILNYGGQPWIPTKNPIGQSNNYY